ncbi:MAG: nuclear transport factor 2 family protein [Pseudomonadota bacterium]
MDHASKAARLVLFFLLLLPPLGYAQSTEDHNRALATAFYEDLWFNNRTERYVDYLADTYVAHDIGDRKGVVEPAIEQKIIADRFWAGGTMSGDIHFQIADGDLVATRWEWRYEPETLLAKMLFGHNSIPIINVFRFDEDGKIVELWNHRHDIDTNMTIIYSARGFALGLVLTLLVGAYAAVLRRRLKRLEAG